MAATTGDQPGLRKRELFALLGYQPHAGQVLVHRSTARKRIVATGVRWGKTRVAAFEAVAALLEPRASALGWVVAPTFDLADLVFAQVVSVFGKHMEYRVRSHSIGERRIIVSNLSGGTSELRAKSADSQVSLIGEGLDFIIVDEAARLEAGIWHQHLSQRLLDRRGWGLLLSTPRGKNWFQRLWVRGQPGGDPGTESWKCPTTENPHIPPEEIAAERRVLASWAFAEQFNAEFAKESTVDDIWEEGTQPDTKLMRFVLPGQDPPLYLKAAAPRP